MPPSPWKTLELVNGQSALPRTWRRYLGDFFLAFKLLCLEPGPEFGILPCPNDCGCYHRIIARHDRAGAIAICRCMPPKCPDIEMTIEEATLLQLDVPKLGRAIAGALDCQRIQADIGPFNTLQIGSWSAAAVPVFLTLNVEPRDLQFTAAHLAATLRDKFILLTPTKDLVTAETTQLLATAGAAIFDLATNIALASNGTIQPTRLPGEIFAAFTPQPKPDDQDAAERAFALIQQLESSSNLPTPTVLTVFRLYCIEALSAAETARRCHCSKATILNRLAVIRKKTGIDPARFRRLSPHIGNIENQLADSRARRINRPIPGH